MKTSLLVSVRFIALALLVASSSVLQAQSISVDFSEDTVYSCLWASVTLNPAVSGGQGDLSWNWNTGDTTQTIYLLSTTVGESMIVLSVSDTAGNTASDSVLVIVLQECVLPGDADGTGLANNFDVLPIGRSFSSVGPVRPNAHTNFIGQAAHDWGTLNSAGVDQVHSDADGDGIVDWNDFAVIDLNYTQAQSSGSSGILPAGVPFYVDFPSGPYNSGDTIRAPIILGTATNPASNIIGIAFSINYDKSLIDSASVRIEYDGSWLGDLDVDMGAVDKDFYGLGQVDVGVSRVDLIARSGYGKVGDIIVAIDDIAGKREITEADIRVQFVSLLDNQGSFIDVNTERSNSQISLSIGHSSLDFQKLGVFPNPATDEIVLELADLPVSGFAELQIFDLQGRKIYQEKIVLGRNKSLNINELNPGVYTINILTKNNIFSNRLSVL